MILVSNKPEHQESPRRHYSLASRQLVLESKFPVNYIIYLISKAKITRTDLKSKIWQLSQFSRCKTNSILRKLASTVYLSFWQSLRTAFLLSLRLRWFGIRRHIDRGLLTGSHLTCWRMYSVHRRRMVVSHLSEASVRQARYTGVFRRGRRSIGWQAKWFGGVAGIRLRWGGWCRRKPGWFLVVLQ